MDQDFNDRCGARLFVYEKRMTYEYEIVIIPQTEIECYRTDFTITFSNQSGLDFIFAVEIDGYDWHSTKQQIQRDKIRERRIISLGIPVIRFTGSEVFNNPEKSVCDCLDTCIEYIARQLSFIPHTAYASIEKDDVREYLMR
jgi:very-short-patch-repair endonuclease